MALYLSLTYLNNALRKALDDRKALELTLSKSEIKRYEDR